MRAHRLLLETNTVTPLLQRMEKLGVVVRKRGKEDKRQQIVSLTAKGKAMEEQAYAIIPAGMGKELKACPFQLDDYAKFASELDTIIETLKKFHRHFETPGLPLYWIIIAYIILGWFFPVIGLLAIICMIGPVVTSIFKGRWWCGHVCPRGNMYSDWPVGHHLYDRPCGDEHL